MSYIGSDDIPLCDLCEVMCPPSFGDGFIAPWPPSGRRWENGRAPEDLKHCFHICMGCLRDLIMRSPMHPDKRNRTRESAARWKRNQALIVEAESIAGRGGTIH